MDPTSAAPSFKAPLITGHPSHCFVCPGGSLTGVRQLCLNTAQSNKQESVLLWLSRDHSRKTIDGSSVEGQQATAGPLETPQGWSGHWSQHRRLCTVDFLEAAKQPRSCTKHGKKSFQSSGLVATCHLFAVDKPSH